MGIAPHLKVLNNLLKLNATSGWGYNRIGASPKFNCFDQIEKRDRQKNTRK